MYAQDNNTLPVWIISSQAHHHISINSQPFLVGIVSGGHHVIVTHEGYVIPLHVHNGLCYVDMKPASDSDLEQYTHVFITLDAPWNPNIVNHEFYFDAPDSLLSIASIQE